MSALAISGLAAGTAGSRRAKASGASSWTPGYALPTAGTALALGTVNKLSSLTVSSLDDNEVEYSMNGSYGTGVFHPSMTAGGVFIGTNSGGHNHPEMSDAPYLDFTDRTFKLLANSNGAPNNPTGWLRAQADLTEGELTGYTQVPVPGHPYFTHAALAGGVKGRYLKVIQCASYTDPGSGFRAHVMDLNTGAWSRYSTNRMDQVTDPNYYDSEIAAIPHVGGNRVYVVCREIHNLGHIAYLDLADATFKIRSFTGGSGFPASGGATSSGFVVESLNRLFVRDVTLGLRSFDISGTGNISVASNTVSVTGTLPSLQNGWFFCAKDSAYYSYSGTGQVIDKMVINSATSVTLSTVTLTGATLPTNVRNGNTRHYGRFFPVPTIDTDIFCWYPGGQNDDAYLIRLP